MLKITLFQDFLESFIDLDFLEYYMFIFPLG